MVTEQADNGGTIRFPGMDPGEEFRFYFLRHWSRLARYIAFVCFWMAAFGLLTYFSGVATIDDDWSRHMTAIVLLAFLLIPHFIFVMKLYKHFLTLVIVTDKKVHQFKRTILAMDSHQSVDLWVLQDIDKSQRGLIQNLLGFGTLKLEAQNTAIAIHFVPQINKIYGVLVGLREEARHRTFPPPPEETAQ